jgi:hypothetical protein
VERYSHGGYLIKVVVMALAGEVTRELSPILSWSAVAVAIEAAVAVPAVPPPRVAVAIEAAVAVPVVPPPR